MIKFTRIESPDKSVFYRLFKGYKSIMITALLLVLTLCVLNEGKNYTLEELKHVFDAPDPMDKSVVYWDNTTDVTCDNITKLVLYLNTDLDLDFLSSCNQLEEFWIVYKHPADRYQKQQYFLVLRGSENIGVKKIHVNVFFYPADFSLDNMNITVLDLSEAGFLINMDALLNFTESLSYNQGPLIALSLDNCLNANHFVDPYIATWIYSAIFGPLKNHTLQYVSLRNNGLVYIPGHVLNILPFLRIFDICENQIFLPDKMVFSFIFIYT
jgi:hypothetical protein